MKLARLLERLRARVATPKSRGARSSRARGSSRVVSHRTSLSPAPVAVAHAEVRARSNAGRPRRPMSHKQALRSGANAGRRQLDVALPVAAAGLVNVPAFWFGGNGETVEAIASLLLLATLALIVLRGNFIAPLARQHVLAVFALSSLLAVWPLVQLVPGLGFGPIAAEWRAFAATTGASGPGTASLATADTRRALLAGLGVWAAFWIGFLYFRRKRTRRLLWQVTLGLVTLNCFYGLAVYATGSNKVLFHARESWLQDTAGGLVSGTFINRVHFALYAALGLGLALIVWATRAAPRGSGGPMRATIKSVFDNIGVCIAAVCGAVCTLALLLSQSRGNLVAAILAAGVFASLGGVALRGRGLGVAAGGVLLAVVVVGTQSDFALQRWRDLGSGAASRAVGQSQTVRATFETAGLGVGAGAFQATFPRYRTETPERPYKWNAAHGSYVELPFTYGLIWCLVALAAAGMVLQRSLGFAPGASRGAVRLTGFLATLVLVNLVFDFGLQTFGIGILMLCLFGSTWGWQDQRLAAAEGLDLAAAGAAQPASACAPRREPAS